MRQRESNEVTAALQTAVETRDPSMSSASSFRPVAAQGGTLPGIVETSQINVMYQTSLQQFLVLFLRSMVESEAARIVAKRVDNIIDVLTYIVYRYINRGLYEVQSSPSSSL